MLRDAQNNVCEGEFLRNQLQWQPRINVEVEYMSEIVFVVWKSRIGERDISRHFATDERACFCTETRGWDAVEETTDESIPICNNCIKRKRRWEAEGKVYSFRAATAPIVEEVAPAVIIPLPAPERVVSLPPHVDVELPGRIDVVVSRIIRDSEIIRDLKLLHRDRCQICGLAITLRDGRTYSEAHHIQALGGEYRGPDVAANILILCPNHHVMCDYGTLQLSLDEMTRLPGHDIDERFIRHHNERWGFSE